MEMGVYLYEKQKLKTKGRGNNLFVVNKFIFRDVETLIE